MKFINYDRDRKLSYSLSRRNILLYQSTSCWQEFSYSGRDHFPTTIILSLKGKRHYISYPAMKVFLN